MGGFPSWQTDPTGRHQERYFNNEGIPTESVRNDGIESIDEGPSAMDSSTPSPTDSTVAIVGPPAAANQSLETASLVARYRAPMVETPNTQLNRAVEASPPSPIFIVRHQRSWWLIAAACVLAVLLIVTGVIVVQQHHVANKWMSDDNAEVKKYQTEVHENVALYGTLVSTRSQLSAVASQKEKALDQDAVLTTALDDATSVASILSTCVDDTDTVLSEIDSSLNSGFIDPSLESDATTAGQVCSQAQSENATLQRTLSGG